VLLLPAAFLPVCQQGFTSKDLGGDGGHFAALPLAQYPLQVSFS
jgi:hypothetical protein